MFNTLIRVGEDDNGAYGNLDIDGVSFCNTIEHIYPGGPKIPDGVYNCVRGMHELGSGPIETFEVMHVPGHFGLLFHRGNTFRDSSGCILLGIKHSSLLIDSRITFDKFMTKLIGVDIFTLHVQTQLSLFTQGELT